MCPIQASNPRLSDSRAQTVTTLVLDKWPGWMRTCGMLARGREADMEGRQTYAIPSTDDPTRSAGQK